MVIALANLMTCQTYKSLRDRQEQQGKLKIGKGICIKTEKDDGTPLEVEGILQKVNLTTEKDNDRIVTFGYVIDTTEGTLVF